MGSQIMRKRLHARFRFGNNHALITYFEYYEKSGCRAKSVCLRPA